MLHIINQTELYQRIAKLLERYLLKTSYTADSESETVYLFRPFPQKLKISEKKNWISLQVETSSPFVQYYEYHFVSMDGVHIWFSESPLNGIPETAMQAPLVDGEHMLSGDVFEYKQVWRSGKLISCYRAPKTSSETENKLRVDVDLGWAINRRIDKEFETPLAWAKAITVLSGLIGCWFVSSWLFINAQLLYMDYRAESLSESSFESIDRQTAMANMVQEYQFIKDWKGRSNYLQEGFSVIAHIFEDNFQWSLLSLQGDRELLQIEFRTQNTDFTGVIPEIENTGRFNNIKIRPSGQKDAWIFEGELP